MWCAPTSRCICILLLSVLQCWPDRFPHAITRAMALSRLQRNQFQTGSRPYRWAHSLGITVSLYVSPTSHSTRVCNWLAVIPFPFISGTDEWKTVDAASLEANWRSVWLEEFHFVSGTEWKPSKVTVRVTAASSHHPRGSAVYNTKWAVAVRFMSTGFAW
jgi:hypothetical protein